MDDRKIFPNRPSPVAHPGGAQGFSGDLAASTAISRK